MKKLVRLKFETEDVPDIAPPRIVAGYGLAGNISMNAEAIFLHNEGAVVMVMLDAIIRAAKEADPRVDLTKEGIKAAHEKRKAKMAAARRRPPKR